MSAHVVPFPRAGTPLLRRDRMVLDALQALQDRHDKALEYIRVGDLRSAEALVMIASMEASEIEGMVMGVRA